MLCVRFLPHFLVALFLLLLLFVLFLLLQLSTRFQWIQNELYGNGNRQTFHPKTLSHMNAVNNFQTLQNTQNHINTHGMHVAHFKTQQNVMLLNANGYGYTVLRATLITIHDFQRLKLLPESYV